MNTLLTFDATRFDRHISKQDDKAMVDYIIKEYGPALQYALRYSENNLEASMMAHYEDAYLNAILNTDDNDTRKFIKRTVDEDGSVSSNKARYDELVELVICVFNGEVGAVLRGIQTGPQKIYTVQVLGYENRLLRVLLTTDRPIIP